MKDQPSLKNVTDTNFGKPSPCHNELLQQLGAPHISSFNYMLDKGLDDAVADLNPVKFSLPSGEEIILKLEGASIGVPTVPAGTIGVKNPAVYPTECRQRAGTYKARMVCTINWSVNGRQQPSFDKELGEVPIMIRSAHCRLAGMSPKELVAHGEHEDEWGGYFVVKGHERLCRMLVMTRRNYPITIKRPTWKTRGSLFSDMGVLMRCVKNDQTATTNVLHYLTDGTAKLMFTHQKALFYSPLILLLKCLTNCSDQYIYKQLVHGREDDMYFCGRVQNMLRLIHEENLHTQEDCRQYIGSMFKVKLFEIPNATNEEATDFLIKNCILIHLDKPEDKFNMLIYMTKKLYSFVQDGCKSEGVDAVMMWELLLAGHLYLQILKEKLQGLLIGIKINLLKRARRVNFTLSANEMQLAARSAGGLERILELFLATGNISSNTGLGLMQDKGLTIVAENINRMRYMSHFRAVHRGSFFMTMRTTETRQLLPDAWGFICPVHTPDGEPCGLLNHLTMNCQVTDMPDEKLVSNIPLVLTTLGMIPISCSAVHDLKDCYTVVLDGRILGHVAQTIAARFVDKLRLKKIRGVEIPKTLEIVLVPIKKVAAQFPGLYLFTGPARMMRPLINLAANQVELVGTFEQIYLDVCVTPEEAYKGVTTHMEMSKTAFLSNLACLIPMPDCNQSPRNMYQCQMGKQTMGTPCHTWNTLAETKMYRLQTPSTPLFRPVHHDHIELDKFAMGTNAIVAVISYTGYDMEDAMIMNKASYERGLAYGCIYKSEFIELKDSSSFFCRNPHLPDLADSLDTDGLPHPGTKLTGGEPLYCYFNADESRYYVSKYKGKEEAYVDNVRLCGSFSSKAPKKACIVFRITRNPTVGDKFASRAGQKGICSQKWPTEDLPFTETGLVPDIVFNPHGFPSRMTIAMMIELMAGKSAALHGLVHDATPFKFNEEDTAIDYFGKLLEAGGYNYYGTETMYSGVDGREMTAQIFFGIVHYQRLRHMVSDKWQVRSTGPIDVLTRQPIKGRKRGGGVRFGEMERDSLISHGTSFLLQDRLFHCSDKMTTLICTSCGTLLGPVTVVTRTADKAHLTETKETCRLCEHGNNISEVEMPYVFRYLLTQLAALNINVILDCKEI